VENFHACSDATTVASMADFEGGDFTLFADIRNDMNNGTFPFCPYAQTAERIPRSGSLGVFLIKGKTTMVMKQPVTHSRL
jgi:hypothetical protein